MTYLAEYFARRFKKITEQERLRKASKQHAEKTADTVPW